jgi:hypothetical protein
MDDMGRTRDMDAQAAATCEQPSLPFLPSGPSTTRSPNKRGAIRIGNKPFLMALHVFSTEANQGEMIVQDGDRRYKFSFRVRADAAVGMANMRDKQLLLFAISAIQQRWERTGKMVQTIEIPIRDFISARNLTDTGWAYKQIGSSLERLLATRVYTNIHDEKAGEKGYFSWISDGRIRYHKRRINGREEECMHSVILRVCDFLFEELRSDPELTHYSPDWLRLSSPTLQRIYEVANANRDLGQDLFKISGERLRDWTAPDTEFKIFKRHFRTALEKNLETGGNIEGGRGMPEFAVYPYNASIPATSVTWARRTKPQDQYFVFVRDGEQLETLGMHLDDIPDWSGVAINEQQMANMMAHGSLLEPEGSDM